MAAEVFGGAVVYYVCTMFQRPLKVWAHHSIINHNDRIWCTLFYVSRNCGYIHDSEERISGAFEKHHGRLASFDVRMQGGRICGIDVVNCDTSVGFKVCEETVCASVEVVSCYYFVARLEHTQNDIERGHARRDGERMLGGGYLGNMMF